MGIEIEKTEFDDMDRHHFARALEHNLAALSDSLAQPGFGTGPRSIGAELEMYLIDGQGRPLPVNMEVLAAAQDEQLTLELNRYNLEYNLSPQLISQGAFVATENEIIEKLAYLRGVASDFGGTVVPIGILPTLTQADFGTQLITDRKRYHALVRQLLLRRGGPFSIDIDGNDPLQLTMSDITLEGANTSFQVHYRVSPEHYAATFNAIQLVTPLALAIAVNSPTLFGHRLWQETRIPLFKQAIDTREVDRYAWNQPARVNFGHGWVREGAFELFREAVRLYPPLLPVCSSGAADGVRESTVPPSLAELRLHQSTVWLWNRPVYDDVDGGHLRIEMRALPAGPTAVDMVANAAFLIGLAEGLRPQLDKLLPAIPFRIAEYNFYRAAQRGLNASVLWPQDGQSGYCERDVLSLVGELLPTAEAGLQAIGVGTVEIERYLSVIEARLSQRQTGASWQLRQVEPFLGKGKAAAASAYRAMLQRYLTHSINNEPVARWA